MHATPIAAPVLDRPAQRVIIVLALLASLALYLLRLAQEASPDGSVAALTLGYTLALAPPLLAALLLERSRDRYALFAALLYAAVLTPLALYTGGAAEATPKPEIDQVIAPYCGALFVATFLLTPFVQALRHGQARHYPALYRHAWDNGLTLAAAAFFTGAGWAILLLWGALFNLIGIDFFEELFEQRSFIYLANGLFTGLGLTLARSQPGALSALLRVCLALGRALLPLLATVALVFAMGLLFSGLDSLWATRRAGGLLLTLVFGLVALTNSVFQDGNSHSPYAAFPRRLAEGALLLLPVYAGLAAWALSLRVQQYGWTTERLWAALISFYALAYALLYATAVLWRGGGWLARIGPANIVIAGLVVLGLLLTQSPLLNFRAIAVDSHVARFEAGQLPGKDLDVDYLRWRSGAEGVEALKALEAHPRVQGDALLLARVREGLAAERPYSMFPRDGSQLDEGSFNIVPAGTALPPLLMPSIKAHANDNGEYELRRCRAAEPCTLLAVSLDDDPALEWVVVTNGGQWPVFVDTPSGFAVQAFIGATGRYRRNQGAEAPLSAADLRVLEPRWKQLELRGQVYVLRPAKGDE